MTPGPARRRADPSLPPLSPELLSSLRATFSSLGCSATPCCTPSCSSSLAGPPPGAPLDALHLYSNLLLCVSLHIKKEILLPEAAFMRIIEAENKILLLRGAIPPPGIPRGLHRECMDLECEQPIESLAFKTYAVLREVRLSAEGLPRFLSLLLLRGEPERLFRVFDRERRARSVDAFRLALLAGLRSGLRDTRGIFGDLRRFLGLGESGTSAEYEKVKQWFIQESNDHNWRRCKVLWKESESIPEASVSMVNACATLGRFHEGWEVFKETKKKFDAGAQKCSERLARSLSLSVLCLCVSAYGKLKTPLWCDRILFLLTSSRRSHVPDFIRETISLMGDLDDGRILAFLMSQVLRLSCRAHLREKDIHCALKESLEVLEEKYEGGKMTDRPMAQICMKSVQDLYVQWRKKARLFGLFDLGGSSETRDEMCKMILKLSSRCQAEDVECFICEEMCWSCRRIDEDVLERVKKIHNMKCGCERRGETAKSFLRHCAKVLKEANSSAALGA